MKISDFVHWMKKYDDLPLLTPRTDPVDDDDIGFDSDIGYCKDLLHDIHMNAAAGSLVRPFPIVLSDELNRAIDELAAMKDRIKDIGRV